MKKIFFVWFAIMLVFPFVSFAQDNTFVNTTNENVIAEPLLTEAEYQRMGPTSAQVMFASFIVLIIFLAFYIYFALSLQFIAKKTSTSNSWLAWIPIANCFLMIKIAQKPLWWFILLLVPIVNIVFTVLIWMEIAKRRAKPDWVGILIIVPFVGLFIPGYLGFSE